MARPTPATAAGWPPLRVQTPGAAKAAAAPERAAPPAGSLPRHAPPPALAAAKPLGSPSRRRAWVAAVLVSLLLHAGLLLALRWSQWPPTGAAPAGAVSLQVFSVAATGGDASDAKPPQQPASAGRTTPADKADTTADPAVTTPAPAPEPTDSPPAAESAASPATDTAASTEMSAKTASTPPSGAADGSAAQSTSRASAARTAKPRSDALAERLETPVLPKPAARTLEDPVAAAKPPNEAHRHAPAPAPEPAATASAPPPPRAAPGPKPRAASKAESAEPEQVATAARREGTAAPERELSGLAALDAEIAAARKARAEAADSDAALSGLAALDAEIEASARQSRSGRANERTAAQRSGRAGATPAGRTPGRSATGAEPAARGQAERRYLAALRRALARERHYPPVARRRGLEGTARVQFTIAADGGFSGIRVSRSAGAQSLDDAAERTVRRLARFDPIPRVIGRQHWTVRVPIVFRLN